MRGGQRAPVLVTGSARCLPEVGAVLVGLMKAMETASSRDPGCLHYKFAHALDDPELYESVEIWASEAHLQEHLAHDHTVEFLAAMASVVSGAPTLATRPLW